MKSKKVIAALCALALVFSSSGGLPFSGVRVFDTAISVSAAPSGTSISSLPTSAGTYYLAQDIEITSTWDVPSGTTTLDLNGHNITAKNLDSAITVNSGADLTLSGNGTISYSSDGNDKDAIRINGGTLTVDGATIESKQVSSGHPNGITMSGGILNFNNGSITLNGSGTVLNVSNGSIANLYNGTFKPDSWLFAYAYGSTSAINIFDGIFKKGSNNTLMNTGSSAKISLSGGYFPIDITSINSYIAKGHQLVDSDDTAKGEKMVAPCTYAVTLDNQGATTSGATGVTATYGKTLPSIEDNLPIKTNSKFDGYFSEPNGKGTKYLNADGTATIATWTTDGTGTLYAQWVEAHTHSFSYTASGSTITASCAGDCDITDGLTMTISAPTDLEYDGNPKEATLNSDYSTTAFPDTYTIEYYSGTTKLSGAPTDRGSYTAKVTAGGKTASVDFTITKTVPYIGYTYNDNGITASSENQCQTYTSVTSSTTTWNNGWYVVDSNVTISSRITVNGNNVHLILCDGCTLNAPKGIRVATGKGLSIYAQSEAAETMGVLNSRTTDDGSSTAAIGGNNGEAAGTIVINGGKITVSGSTNGSAGGGAGIGSGRYASDANTKKMKIVINGGIIKNNSLKSVCAIGGGQGCGGGKILINGGNLDLNTYSGAAIGRAYAGANGYTNITINGGTIAARAWTAAPGIGGEQATVKITGGNIIAYSGSTNNGILGKSVTFGDNMVVRSGTKNDLSKALPCLDYIQSTTNKKFVALWEHTHSLSYDCAGNHFAVKCANDNCNLIDGELGLTLYADDKEYDGTAYDLQHSDCDSFAHTFADEFKLLTGETISIGDIELYSGENKIDEAVMPGTYTAKQIITVGTEEYTIEKSFRIIGTDPTYTITIPATVDLKSTDPVSIEAEGVELNEGQKIVVTLDGASHTTSGSEFSAKDKSGESVVSYSIKAGDTDVTVGGTVAEFVSSTDPQSVSLDFTADASKAKYAGAHSEVLTFGISVESNPYAANNVGDEVTFGIYDWYIIGKSDNGVKLLMKENLTTKAYNDSYAKVTWENCSLRTYLNGDFYNNNFSEEERAKIALTRNENPNNPEYSTSGGSNTEDHIYLLSIAEANALDSNIRKTGSWWWLRSPGDESIRAAIVLDDGNVLTGGSAVVGEIGVRPVINLKF